MDHRTAGMADPSMIEALRQSLETRPTLGNDVVPRREHETLLQDYYAARDDRARAEAENDEMDRTIAELRDDLEDARRQSQRSAELDEAHRLIADLRGQIARNRSLAQRDTNRREAEASQLRAELERERKRADWGELKIEHMRRRLMAWDVPPTPRANDLRREPTEADIRRARPHRDMPQEALDRAVAHGEIARDVYHEGEDEFQFSDEEAPPSSDVDSEGRPKVKKGWLKAHKAKAREAAAARANTSRDPAGQPTAGPSTRIQSPSRAMDVDAPPPAARPPPSRRGAGRGAAPSRHAPAPYRRQPRFGDRLEDRLAQRAQTRSLVDRVHPVGGPSTLEDRLGLRQSPGPAYRDIPTAPPLPTSPARIPTPPPTSLLQRVEQHALPDRPATILPPRTSIPGGEYPLPPDREIRASYIAESEGPLRRQYDGFRVVYGRLLDLRRHFPAVPPTPYMINPLTGRAWTPQELRDYPLGYPGWPSNSPSGDVMTEAERIGFPVGTGVSSASGGRDAVQRSDRHLVSLFDRTDTLLAWMRSDAPGNVDGYRWPANETEARRFRDIAHQACNFRANELWGKYRDVANKTPRALRSRALAFATDPTTMRPTWAEYRRTKARRRDPGEVTLNYGSPPRSTNAPLDEEHQAGPVAPMTTESIDDHPVPSSAVLPPVDVDRVREWQEILRAYPELQLPGIMRAEDGTTNTAVLRGLLQAATTGPVNTDPSGRAFVAYVNLLAEALRQVPNLTPNQLMGFEYYGHLELSAIVEALHTRMDGWVEPVDSDFFTDRLEHLASVETWVLTVRANPPGVEEEEPLPGMP